MQAIVSVFNNSRLCYSLV